MSIFKGFLSNPALKFCCHNKFEYYNVRTMKSLLKVKWVRPDKLPYNHPKNSGDPTAAPRYKKGTILTAFQSSTELETANEDVKKIFSIDMNGGVPKYTRYKEELQKKVQRHPNDLHSHEVKIAHLTARIRHFQEYAEKNPSDKKMKVRLQHSIDNRKRQLTHLRRWDYPRFEWLLEKLDIIYKPHPTIFDKVTRKKSLTQLTTIHCEQLKEKRIAAFKKVMEAAKVPFMEKKLHKLKWIQQQEVELSLPKTVTDEDIAQCEHLLEKLRVEEKDIDKKNYERVIHPYTLEKYDPEALRIAENKNMG